MLLDRLRRITRDGRWIPEIDGLRFIAIVAVFLSHLAGELAERSFRRIPIAPPFLDTLAHNGDRGVVLFFVISGLILALPFARQHLLGARPVALRKYYVRRLTRLEPPYLLCIVLCTALLAVYLRPLPPGFTGHVFATLFYQHSQVYNGISTINPVTWSLEVEIQFYLLAPLLMQSFRIRPALLRRALLLAVILALGIAQTYGPHNGRFNGSILFYLQYFLAGLFVADIITLELDLIPTSWLWDALGFSALVALFWSTHEAPLPHTLLPFAIAILCLSALRSRALRALLATPVIAVTGGMCYSIYLLHFIFIAVLFKLTRHAIVPSFTFAANFAIQILVTGIPVLALCTVFYVLIERPCMDPDWPSKLYRRLTGRPSREAQSLDTHGISD